MGLRRDPLWPALGNASAALRAEIFLTTKIPCVASAAAALQYIEQDLEQLGVKQVDLLLIHSPGKFTTGNLPVACDV